MGGEFPSLQETEASMDCPSPPKTLGTLTATCSRPGKSYKEHLQSHEHDINTHTKKKKIPAAEQIMTCFFFLIIALLPDVCKYLKYGDSLYFFYRDLLIWSSAAGFSPTFYFL